MKVTITVIACIYLAQFTVSGQKERIEKVRYDGDQVWKIHNDNKTTLTVLKELEDEKYITLWGKNSTKIDTWVHSSHLNQVRQKLQETNQTYVVKIEDLQKLIDEANPKPEDLDARKSFRLTWNYYHNLKDIIDYLHYLEGNYKDLVTVRTIGRSVEGRPIKLLKLSNKNPKNKAIFIEGGIHAREWISPASVTYIINKFIENNKDPLVQGFDWYFVPVLNPDGYEYSYSVERLWRKNRSRNTKGCFGVDLNRNWGYDWGAKNGSMKDPCSNHYGGRKPFSEPETAAVASFFINNPNINWMGYISLHSYGQYIVYPWGSTTTMLEDHDEMNKIGTEAAMFISTARNTSYKVGAIATTIYLASGNSADWARGSEAVKFAFSMELTDHGHFSFILPANLINVTSEDALVLVKTVAKAVSVYNNCQMKNTV